MQTEEVKALIEAGIPGSEATVHGDGSHFDAVVVSPEFEGKSPVVKQKMVYATVTDNITSGELHALTIKAYTPAEWEKAKSLQVTGA
ncbi:MAG: BolA family transcriptional regulator [Gammaproteobacteria bacterium]|nr:BolA family transcriptional regulator [Gammaproteobacteria bacterium]